MADPVSELDRLAAAVGLQRDWEDASGKPQRVSDEALRRVLTALGRPAETAADISRSLEEQAQEEDDCRFLSADAGSPVPLPGGCAASGEAELLLEDGGSRRLAIRSGRDGAMLPPITETGYHLLRIGDRELRIAVAPVRCFGVGDVAQGRRLWGPAVQVPALRDGRDTGFGDFGTLAASAEAFARRGADALAISPTHALFPADARRFSPYAPSSRLFHNILFGDPALAGHAAPTAAPRDLIGWEEAIPERIEALRAAFAGASEPVLAAVPEWRRSKGRELERHATFDALHAHFHASGAHGWQDWPTGYRDPESEAVAAFAAEHRDEVDFYVFAQWLAAQSLTAAQERATGAGMALGLIADLAVGMDAGGSHAWSRRDELLTGLSIGAPPDPLGPDGQDWGITGFSPSGLRRTGFDAFIATLRAALDHAGGLRIDHALGLRRLWVVPHGASSAEGAYLRYPLDDMLRILALESQRARAIVIGEDLGTVPEGLRPKLEAREILGMRVLWFERTRSGGFVAPERWRPQAVAMTGTHDLPTVAGWWSGRDIEWAWELGRRSEAADEATARSDRAKERTRLWDAFCASGAAEGPEPPAASPEPAVDAALAHVGATPCTLALVPMEDVVGAVEQPNLPGTIDEHPNWRRRMPRATEALLAEPAVDARLERLNLERRR
ncbi:4-alpha-glucanotransferase [Sphingosinithalassobacter sp. LHW66-3]|uniref:4-alpha-glucanotransferase n=1 Tax=Sphingosinithalassobacter sp. LHW66-3 TaxID=3424718 RepID=UPI003D6BEEE5